MVLHGMTHIGKKRENNQDVFYTHQLNDQVGFAIVCDGMGGQSAGHIASDMACSEVAQNLLSKTIGSLSKEEIRELLLSSVNSANLKIYKKGNLEPGCKGMGTTCIAVIIKEGNAYIAHVGDSRVYLYENSSMRQITKDHSLIQDLVDSGKITELQGRHHPKKNMLTRAVGVEISVDIDFIELPFSPGTKLLLCTDGLTNMVSDQMIGEILGAHDAKTTCSMLIELANEAGGVDNITVAVVE